MVYDAPARYADAIGVLFMRDNYQGVFYISRREDVTVYQRIIDHIMEKPCI